MAIEPGRTRLTNSSADQRPGRRRYCAGVGRMRTQFFTAPDMLNFAAKTSDGNNPPMLV
jgi:hypothetical protein